MHLDEAYTILGVPLGFVFDSKTLDRYYRKACMRHHPDKGGDTEQFIRVQEAYTTVRSKLDTGEHDTSSTRTDWLHKLFCEYITTFLNKYRKTVKDQKVVVNVSVASVYAGDVKRVQYKRLGANKKPASNVFYLDLRAVRMGTHVLKEYGDWNDTANTWEDLYVDLSIEPSSYWIDDLEIDNQADDNAPLLYTSYMISIADYYFGVNGTIILPNGDKRELVDMAHVPFRDGIEMHLEGDGLLYKNHTEYKRGVLVIILQVDMQMVDTNLLIEDKMRNMFPNIYG